MQSEAGFHNSLWSSHLLQEVIDNSADEAIGGYATEISITCHDDKSFSVSDNGRGIPVGMHPEEKISTIELVFTRLHAGGKFNKDNNTELSKFFNKFHINIKLIKLKEKNSIKTFVENNYKSDIFRVSCFQGEDTFNKRLQFICNMYTSNGFILKEEIEKYLKKLFNNIKLDFIDENSSLIIFKYVNNELDKIILNFEEELIKEINKERKFKTINHYFEDNKIYNELQNIIDSTTINNSLSKIEKIRELCNNYKNLSLEQRQKQNIVDALTNYENQTQNKNILDNINSVIQEYVNKEIIEWINGDLCEFIRDNDDIKEDDKIREKRIELNQDIKKYEECLHILKN